MTDLELRHARRYQLAAPVNFWWPSPHGTVRAGKGVSRDISSCGVMVMTSECPPVGARIQLKVFLQRAHGRGSPLELQAEGAVVRVEGGKPAPSGERKSGFAASAHFYPEVPSDSDFLGKDGSESQK